MISDHTDRAAVADYTHHVNHAAVADNTRYILINGTYHAER